MRKEKRYYVMQKNDLKKKKDKAAKVIRALKKLFPNAKIALDYSNNWELLVAVMLSAQCTDKKVNEVTAELFKKYRALDDYVRALPEEFQEDIRPTGFFRAKTKHILATAKIIKKRYKGNMPNTMEALLTLPGVARKTANVVLGNAYKIMEGIAVDTHVKRLARLLGLTNEINPERIEKDLMQIIPKSEWFDFTYRLIEYGRTYCIARPHDHENCPLTPLEVFGKK